MKIFLSLSGLCISFIKGGNSGNTREQSSFFILVNW